ncbi:MAG: protein kinase, partial [Polyangiales bacterium]
HCDVSPSNVMLSTDGYVKILDFGIARATFASALERRRLRGKPRYMAPEQTLGEPPTAAADVFALGIIAWELFTGLPLYRGANLKAILEAVRTTNPPRIDRLNAAVPKEIADAVATALQREPPDRGTAADLAQACTRSAMAAGARALAAWLAELESRPSMSVQAWQAEVTGIGLPKPAETPPPRPSVRSITASLANVPSPGGDFGEGTPGFADPTATSPQQRFDTKDPSTTAVSRYEPTSTAVASPPRPEPTASATGHRFLDQATATSTRWGPEATVAGGGRLVDALPEDPAFPSFQNREATVPNEPFSRPSYEMLQLLPGVAPSSLRFDDDVTHHSYPMAGAPEDTSYDSLEVDGEEPAPQLDGLADEPIDDDLGSIAAGVLAERRRAVVVAGILAGAPPEVLRPVTRSLGELAYQRGGVVIAQQDDLLMVAFGLEVAGEDDVAIAMGWALDAAALARDASDGVVLKVGARTGVVTTASSDGAVRIPPEASEEAVALARESAPERPMFVGTTGRLTSDLYTLRELPAPKRIARRSRVIEVVGPRSLDDRERARLEKLGKYVGRTKELAELEVWFQRAIAADRRLVVLISGAAGTGKSRLVAELTERRLASGTPTRVV